MRLALLISELLPSEREGANNCHGSEDHDRIRDVIAGKLRNSSEDEYEYQHCQEWTNYSPADADDRLLVANEHIAPSQEVNNSR